MKSTPAFHLHLLAILLLAPGGFLTSALPEQCRPTFRSYNNEYKDITIVPGNEGKERNRTLYVLPEQNLKVELTVDGMRAEFLLKKECFGGGWQWRSLLVKVKFLGIDSGNNQTTYTFEVRTSKCIELCIEKGTKKNLSSLQVRASGNSGWKFNYLENVCGHIPQWKPDAYLETRHWCSELISSSTSMTTSAMPTTTSTEPTPTTTEPTPITTEPTPTTTEPTPTTTEPTPITTEPTTTTTKPSQVGGAIGGVIAGIVVVAVIVMIVVRNRRTEPLTEEVAMRPQNTESPREGQVNSLYEPTDRQEPVHDTADRQSSANSLYETVDRQGSVNSLYEPFENFRAAQ